MQRHSLVNLFFDKLDSQFWTYRSTKANQFILMCLAAVLSELMSSDSLAEVMVPIVVKIVSVPLQRLFQCSYT